MTGVQEDITEIRALIDPLLANSQPRLFIKPEGDMNKYEAEAMAPAINKWGIYEAVR